MITTVFLFHPHLEDSRINARLARTARAATTPDTPIHVRDMYALYPDFHINVPTEQTTLTTTDRIVLQFPVYWYSCPPLLKKWEDDVLTHGWAYGSTGTALHGKELALSVSTGSPAPNYTHDGTYHYTLTELLRPFQATSSLIGTRFTTPFTTTGTHTITDEDLNHQATTYTTWLTSTLPQLGTFE